MAKTFVRDWVERKISGASDARPGASRPWLKRMESGVAVRELG